MSQKSPSNGEPLPHHSKTTASVAAKQQSKRSPSQRPFLHISATARLVRGAAATPPKHPNAAKHVHSHGDILTYHIDRHEVVANSRTGTIFRQDVSTHRSISNRTAATGTGHQDETTSAGAVASSPRTLTYIGEWQEFMHHNKVDMSPPAHSQVQPSHGNEVRSSPLLDNIVSVPNVMDKRDFDDLHRDEATSRHLFFNAPSSRSPSGAREPHAERSPSERRGSGGGKIYSSSLQHAWDKFCRTATSEFSLQELKLVSCDTLRMLMERYGFRQPEETARIEAQWALLQDELHVAFDVPPPAAPSVPSLNQQASPANRASLSRHHFDGEGGNHKVHRESGPYTSSAFRSPSPRRSPSRSTAGRSTSIDIHSGSRAASSQQYPASDWSSLHPHDFDLRTLQLSCSGLDTVKERLKPRHAVKAITPRRSDPNTAAEFNASPKPHGLKAHGFAEGSNGGCASGLAVEGGQHRKSSQAAPKDNLFGGFLSSSSLQPGDRNETERRMLKAAPDAPQRREGFGIRTNIESHSEVKGYFGRSLTSRINESTLGALS